MKLAILTNKIGRTTPLFVKKAKDKGHQAVGISIKNISLTLGKNKVELSYKKQDLLSFDVALVRGWTNRHKTKVVLDILYDNGVKVIDERLVKGYDNNSKLYTYKQLQKNNIPFPPTYLLNEKNWDYQNIIKLFSNKHFIAKVITGSQGSDVYLIKCQKDLTKLKQQLTNKKKSRLVFQKYIPHDGDYRILVVGYKALGAMYRKKDKDEYRSNISQGGIAKQTNLTKDLQELALKAAKAVKMEIAGVDIIRQDDNNYNVIEVNRNPQFKGFTKATNVDFVEEVINYCEKKYNEKNNNHRH